MNLLQKILNIGFDKQATELHNFTVRLLNQIALTTFVLIGLYMTAHIMMQNSWIAILFDIFYIITAFLILYFNARKKFLFAYFTVGIGYTIAFACSSLLIGSQNQIEYLLFVSGIGTALLLDNQNHKQIFFYFTLIVFIGLKVFHIYHPQGLLEKDFSPYFRIVNGSLVFIFMYVIVSKTLNNSELLLKKLQSKNDEISNLNETLEVKVKERTAALTQSNKELKKFAYISAHDLREPLRNILGFSKLLKKSIAKKDNTETELNLNYINWGVKRIDAITRDIVSYSELEENIKKVDLVDFNKLVQQIVTNVKLNRNNIRFQITPLPIVNINLESADILLENLIYNAVQYCDKPTNKITIGYKKIGQFHQFKISDEGFGIEEQYHEKVFEMFTRLHNDFDRNGSGTGLAFCKKIVESYGGGIWVESEYTKGCDFYFTLPV